MFRSSISGLQGMCTLKCKRKVITPVLATGIITGLIIGNIFISPVTAETQSDSLVTVASVGIDRSIELRQLDYLLKQLLMNQGYEVNQLYYQNVTGASADADIVLYEYNADTFTDDLKQFNRTINMYFNDTSLFGNYIYNQTLYDSLQRNYLNQYTVNPLVEKLHSVYATTGDQIINKSISEAILHHKFRQKRLLINSSFVDYYENSSSLTQYSPLMAQSKYHRLWAGSLFYYDDGAPYHYLSENYQMTPQITTDGKVYNHTFTLKNMTYPNGDQFVAADLAFTIELLNLSCAISPNAHLIDDVINYSIHNSSSISITTNKLDRSIKLGRLFPTPIRLNTTLTVDHGGTEVSFWAFASCTFSFYDPFISDQFKEYSATPNGLGLYSAGKNQVKSSWVSQAGLIDLDAVTNLWANNNSIKFNLTESFMITFVNQSRSNFQPISNSYSDRPHQNLTINSNYNDYGKSVLLIFPENSIFDTIESRISILQQFDYYPIVKQMNRLKIKSSILDTISPFSIHRDSVYNQTVDQIHLHDQTKSKPNSIKTNVLKFLLITNTLGIVILYVVTRVYNREK